MELKELQIQFKSHLFSQESTIAQHIVSDVLSSDFRLSIYANAYVGRLIEALENDYPVLKTLLGEDSFYELCQRYIAQHPSIYTSLRWFGQHMPAFLQDVQSYSEKPYLAEMAEFEWTLVNSFNAADQESIHESDVAQVPAEKWPELGFGFHPSVYTFPYQWNILPIWWAHKERQPLPKTQQLSAPETCLVWRRGLKTLFRTLENDEVLLLTAARDAADFSQLCELLSEQIGEIEAPQQIPLRAASLLKTWITDEMVANLNY